MTERPRDDITIERLEHRLEEVEAVVQTLVARVTQLGAEIQGSRGRAPEVRAPVAETRAPVARPAAPTPPAPPTPLITQKLPTPRPEPSPEPPRPTPPAPPPRPPRRSAGELARDWDLMGARGFAIAGGAVMALGIGLFFVLAANRGWIDDRGRVALGAAASILVFGAGLVLRARYGQYWSALAAVAAGIAGAYATLAAAAARYDLVPDALALPAAGLIAAAGTVVAIRWRSQMIAAIGLLGAALAPALQALDTEMTWESAAFAVIVLVAVGSVTVSREWNALLIATSVVVGAQVEWLVADTYPDAAVGAVVVSAAFVLALLGICVARQLVARRPELDPVSLSYALAAFGATLLLAVQLFDTRADRGSALLVAAAVWALCFVGLHSRRLPDLALAVGTSALALAAVGTADLLSDAALTMAWAAEAIVLAFLARRLGDVRLQALGIVYAVLAAASALATDARLSYLFVQDVEHLPAVLPLAACAAAALACGVFAPRTYRPRTESGLLAFVGELRAALSGRRDGIRQAFVVTALALGTLSVAFLCVWVSWEWGHILASVVAAAVGACILAAAGRVGSDQLAAVAYTWLGLVLAEALAFDVASFAGETGFSPESTGGFSVMAAAAGLLAGSYAHRLTYERTIGRDVLLGVCASVAAATGALGMAVAWDGGVARGLGFVGAAIVYSALAALVFSRAPFRDVSTILWAIALLFVVGAELFLVDDPVARAVALSATALVVGAVSLPLREIRLWLAGASLALATTAVVVLAQAQPWRDGDDLDRILALGLLMSVFSTVGLAALRFREPQWRDAVTVLWGAGVVALLAAERVLLGDWSATTFAVALTGAALTVVARLLSEERVWAAGLVVASTATFATLASFTPPSHLLAASEAPAAGIWVLVGCILALLAAAATAWEPELRVALGAVAGAGALYALSLGILQLAVLVSTASVETDFERGHTAVSALWALVGLGLLVVGLLRGSALIRYGGLALFGLSLAKIFLYDLAELSSIARAFSFILVGALLLAGGFFLQRLSGRLGPPRSAD